MPDATQTSQPRPQPEPQPEPQPTWYQSQYGNVTATGNARVIVGNVCQQLNDEAFRRPDRIVWRDTLQVLQYDGMRARKAQLSARAGKPDHIDWIWQTTFPQWLQGDGAFYWITGRPGSGKSTLMKHIADSRKTQTLLEKRGGRWTVVQFYFDFRAGQGEANTMQGMLRSMLYQLITCSRDLADLVDPAICAGTHTDLDLYSWIDTLCQVVQSSPAKICAFIDGLDEFDGHGIELLELLCQLEDRLGLKLCLACRPYPIFRESLSKHPKIVMQEHNEPSIRMYAEAKLHSDRLNFSGSLPQDLVIRICERAQGVFLWARLAVDELLQAFILGKPLPELGDSLEQMPEEVNAMYNRALDRIHPRLKLEAALLLHMVLTYDLNSDGVPVNMLFAALESIRQLYDCEDGILAIDHSADNQYRLLSALGDFIDTVPAGRLENGLHKMLTSCTTFGPENKPYSSSIARLSHETARSFLASTTWIKSRVPPGVLDIRVNSFWPRLFLNEIKTTYTAIDRPKARQCIEQIIPQVKCYIVDLCSSSHPRKDFKASGLAVDGVRKLMRLWPHWTPLLPYALQNAHLSLSDLQDMDTSFREAYDSGILALHCAMCACRRIYTNDLFGPRVYSPYVECRCEDVIYHAQKVGWDLALSNVHGPIQFFSQILQTQPILTENSQIVFNLVWKHCISHRVVDDNLASTLHRSLAMGARLNCSHLCCLIRCWGSWSRGFALKNSFEDIVARYPVDDHCICRELGLSDYSNHFVDWTQWRSSRKDGDFLRKTLGVLLENHGEYPRLNIPRIWESLLVSERVPLSRSNLMQKTIIALQAGAFCTQDSDFPTTLLTATKLLERSPDSKAEYSPSDEEYERMIPRRHTEARKICELLELYCVEQSLSGIDLEDFMKVNVP